MKRNLALLIAALGLLAALLPAASAAEKEIEVYINDAPLAADVAPYLQGDRVLVPLRAMSEALGFDVLWAEDESKVTITKPGTEIALWIDDTRVLVNGAAAAIDVPATIKSGRTFVPVRFVSEQLGQQVYWVTGQVHVFAAVAQPTPATTVTVSTAADFLKEIGPDKHIILTEGVYDLTEALRTAQATDCMIVEETLEGQQLVIRNAANLVIEGAGRDKTRLVLHTGYASVLTLQGCQRVALKNLALQHSDETATQAGEALFLKNAADVTLEQCLLSGGRGALCLQSGANISIRDTVMECGEERLLLLDSISHVFLDGCTFRDASVYCALDFYASSGVYFTDCVIEDVHAEQASLKNSFFESSRSEKIYFLSSTLRNNTGDQEPRALAPITFEDCTMENNSFDAMLRLPKYDAAALTLEDLGLGGIVAGMTRDEVVARKGAPTSEGAGFIGFTHAGDVTTYVMKYPDMEIGLSADGAEGFVVSMMTKDPALKTPRGIGLGSSRAEVLQQYGYSWEHLSNTYTYGPPQDPEQYRYDALLDFVYLYIDFEEDVVAEIGLRCFRP